MVDLISVQLSANGFTFSVSWVLVVGGICTWIMAFFFFVLILYLWSPPTTPGQPRRTQHEFPVGPSV